MNRSLNISGPILGHFFILESQVKGITFFLNLKN